MQITLARLSSGPESTIGALYVDGRFACFTIEDQYRAVKVAGETRIPAGEYEIKLRTVGGFHQRYAVRFPNIHRGMLWLMDVPGFEYILLHCGNTDADTDGCILVGDGVHENVTTRGYLNASTSAYTRLYPQVAAAIAQGERVTIKVEDRG